MAWVFDSIDKDPSIYKDFIAILKTYTYRQSSYMFLYILVAFTFEY